MFSYKDPGKAANPYLDKTGQQTQESMQPYTDMSSIGPQLQQQYGQMASNPVQNLEDIRSQYKQTPGHKRALYDAMMAADNAAASGGMIGTPMHQEQMMETAAAINNPYERQWTQDVLDQQRFGLQGQQGLFDTSMGANRYANDINSSLGMSRANLAINDREFKNKNKQQIMQWLMSGGGGSSLGGSAGGALGGFFGGPLGGIAGKFIGNKLFGLF